MESGLFTRGQVEWALWHALARGTTAAIPDVFRNRIKRLLEIDRQTEEFGTTIAPPVRYAFSEEGTEGTGNQALFTSFDTFCVAVALELLDAGFKQGEIVFMMRFLRLPLWTWHGVLLPRLPIGRGVIAAEDKPEWPSYIDESGTRAADPHVFLVLQKVDLSELLPRPVGRPVSGSPPLFLQPEFYGGYEALNARICKHMPWGFRKAFIMELALTASKIQDCLSEAPEFRRGPK